MATVTSPNTGNLTLLQKLRKSSTNIKYMISGMTSAFFSRVASSPFERVVILKQIGQVKQYESHNKRNSTLRLLWNIKKKEGLYGIFKGNGINFVKNVPLVAIEFFVFDKVSSMLNSRDTNRSNRFIISLVAGGMAGAVAYSAVYPIDFTRVMVCVNHIPKEIPFHKLMVYLYKKHGLFSFFRGLSVTLVGIIPFCGAKFVSYDILTTKLKAYKKLESLSMGENMMCGLAAGIIGATVNYPLDVIRRRRQTQIIMNKTKNFSYKNMITYIYKKHGLTGFIKGVTGMYYKVGSTTAVAFMLNEKIKEVLHVQK